MAHTRKKDIRPQKRLFSLEDTSIYLGCSMGFIKSMLDNGKLPFIRDGKRVFIDIRDIDIWIERNKQVISY